MALLMLVLLCVTVDKLAKRFHAAICIGLLADQGKSCLMDGEHISCKKWLCAALFSGRKHSLS